MMSFNISTLPLARDAVSLVRRLERTTGVSYELGKYVQDVSRQQDKPLKEQLTKWTKTVTDINNHINNNIITNANKLDPALSDKITRQIEPVQKVVAQLGRVAKNDAVIQQAKKVDDELSNQKQIMLNHIDGQCDVLLDIMKNELLMVSRKIHSLKDTKTVQIRRLKGTLNDAQHYLRKIDVEYTDTIQKHFNEISGKVTELDPKNTDSGAFDDECRIRRDVVGVRRKLVSIGENLEIYMADLDRWMEEAKTIIDAAKQNYADKILDIAKGVAGSKKNIILNAADEVEEKIVSPLKDYIQKEVIGEITRMVEKAQSEVNALDGKVRKDLEDIKTKIDNGIWDYIVHLSKAAKEDNLNDIVDQLNVKKIVKGLKAFAQGANGDNIKTSAYQALYFDLQKRFASDAFKAADAFSTHVKNVMKEYNKHKVGPISSALDAIKEYPKVLKVDATASTLQKFSTTIKDNLDALTLAFSDAGGHIRSSLITLENININNKLNGIKEKINSLQSTSLAKVIEETNKTIFEKVKKLEEVPNIVDTKRKQTFQKMQELKNELQNHLNNIKANVGIAYQEFTKAIQAVLDKLIEAHKNVENSIITVKQTLIDKTENAFSTLTSAVRSLFSASHAADLQALRALVDQQLREVQNIIARDAVTGVKGMLKWMKGTGEYSLGEIQKIVPTPTQPTLTAKDHSGKFKDLSTRFEKYADKVLVYIEGQVKTPNKDPSQDPESNPQSDNVHDIQGKLDYLLNYLKRNTSGNLSRPYNFDHTSNELLDKLKKSISALSPSTFHGSHNPLLLDALRRGMDKFTEQLSHAYVNTYSGCKPVEKWEEDKKIDNPQKPGEDITVQVLSTEGRNCAKVCLTVFDILSDKWDKMESSCGSHGDKQIHSGMIEKPGANLAKQGGKAEQIKNKLGAFFSAEGFTVSDNDKTQNGELNKDKNGSAIKTLCEKEIDISNPGLLDVLKRLDLGITHKSIKLNELVNYLYHILDKYRHACHLRHIPGAKPPTNICQMLYWLAGLYWNRMYNELRLHFDTWFKASTNDYKLSSDSFDVAAPYRDASTMKATVSIKNIKDLFNTVTLRSYEILRAFVGHGHADGRYACEFYTNPDNLEYPNDISKCFDMLVDICLRLNYQLHFLYTQCCNGPDSSGWRDCHYGRHVGGSNWNCNKFQCPGQQGDQSANQIANQTCEQHPKCCIKSPSKHIWKTVFQASSHIHSLCPVVS
ncbi:hypothetical protein, conserved [Babesia ovata]|uniref:Extracellular matrix-binding ebh n=1 Tax=Babesia ovata TaxID=189622 RepID=A0A2H6KJ62_9APIC|nr:uncharacterized protein BOVATA_045270 [Babesia ovata]GBE63034.1 hypothetical protein, conserved [Babesia ovata]